MWIFWVLFAVAAVLLIFWMLRIERVRLATHVKECRAAAAKMGLSYEYAVPDTLVAKIKGFDLTYSDGDSLRNGIRDIFAERSPTEDMYFFLHEHRGSMPGGVGGTGHRETVGCLVSKRLRLPHFRLSPERPIEKIASTLGARDVDFESHPAFSRSYFLNTNDETAVRALFDSTVLDFFYSHPGFHVEGNADTLVIYQFNRSMSVNELPAFLETVRRMSDLFKR
jgi:hypothetical protein